MHSLGRVVHQVCVVLDTTASPGHGLPHQMMEERLATGVLEVITVPRAPQHQYPVQLDIIATIPEMQISPTAFLVFQVGLDNHIVLLQTFFFFFFCPSLNCKLCKER